MTSACTLLAAAAAIPEKYARYAKALALRRSGLTYEAIGIAVGGAEDKAKPVSRERARQMAYKGERLEAVSWNPPR